MIMKSKKESNVAIQYTYLSATVYFRAESLFERPPEVSVDRSAVRRVPGTSAVQDMEENVVHF